MVHALRRTVATTALLAVSAAGAAAAPADYAAPQDALDALIAALVDRDIDAILTVFGDEARDLLFSGDPAEDRANRDALLDMYAEGYRFAPRDEGGVELLLGADGWPFPIPLTDGPAGWAFDIEAGSAELQDREVGLNELDVITLLDAYVDLQAVYRLSDHDGDGVMEFAASVISASEDRNGLFWPGDGSLIGAQFARASADGFSDGEEDYPPEPFHGYYFRILDAQGDAAPGGAMSYLVNGHMVAGHALLAVPAEYGVTGVSSFLVGENGVIFEADLGEDTLDLGLDIIAYDPGEGWTPVED
jgi:hypothetical protein